MLEIHDARLTANGKQKAGRDSSFDGMELSNLK